jgi:hypothetical protein
MAISTPEVIVATKANLPGFSGSNRRADTANDRKKATNTTQPSHVDGGPQPQPIRLAGNQ